MAAHSPASVVIAVVPDDQPLSGWPTWLRQIAGAVNRLASWAQLPVLGQMTFATLPGAPAMGTLALITDASVATWGANAAGGGTTPAILWFNGAAWKVLGV